MNRYLYIVNDSAAAKRFLRGLFVAIFCLIGAAFWQPAYAQGLLGYSSFTCNADGSANGNLFYESDTINPAMTTINADGTTTSTQNITDPNTNTVTDPTVAGGLCSANMGIFSRLLCFFKTTIGQIMSSMYCGFQNALRGPLNAVLTLFVVVFGIAIATGMVHLTVKEAMKAIFKIALVWVFATNADWGIGVGYRFFMAVAEGGSNLVLGAMNATNQAANAGASAASLTQPDAVLLSIFHVAANGQSGNAPSSVMNGLGISGYCASWLAVGILGLLVTVPPVAIFLILMVLLYIGLYARAMLGYLTALVLISFLFVLAPLFVSFSLFKATEKLFQQWIKYLITYSLQMIIVFAFLAMLEMVPVGTFFLNVTNLLKEYDTTYKVFGVVFPAHACGICDPGIINPTAANMLSTTSPLACQKPPASVPLPAGDILSSDSQYNVIPLPDLLQHQDFIAFLLAEIVALWLIGYVMEDFLKKAPDIAKEIGMLPMALVLGGKSALGGAQPNYAGMESIEAGFQGFKNQLTKDPFSLNWPRRIIGAVSGGLDGFLHGAMPDTPETRELEAQEKDAVSYLDEMQREYDHAQQLTVRNYETWLQDRNAAKSSNSQKDYIEAQKNEHHRKELLDKALKRKAEIEQSINKIKRPGLAESLMRDFFKALGERIPTPEERALAKRTEEEQQEVIIENEK